MSRNRQSSFNLKRVERLIKLLGLLQGGRPRNATSLAQECGVHRRTIFRDLDTFRRCGLNLLFDEHHQGYILPERHFLPPTNFTHEEALLLIVLCYELGDKSQLPFYGAARSAAAKLESSLPADLRKELREVANAVRIRLEPAHPLENHRTTYDTLLAAIAKRRCVRVSYQPPAGEALFRTKLSPYRLFFSRRSWYVIGRSSLHRSKRTFHLGRIAHIETLEDGFTIPKGFSLERHLRNAWHMIPESGRDQNVVIHFDPLVADNVAEVVWHKTQRTRYNDDGSLRFEVTVSGLREISWWILGYADQAEVIEPPELRKMIADRAKKLVKRYDA